jgi:hypothetical protein
MCSSIVSLGSLAFSRPEHGGVFLSLRKMGEENRQFFSPSSVRLEMSAK